MYLLSLVASIFIARPSILSSSSPSLLSFKDLTTYRLPPHFAVVIPPNSSAAWSEFAHNITTLIAQYLRDDLNYDPVPHFFNDSTTFLNWTYDHSIDPGVYLLLGIDFSYNNSITVAYNDSDYSSDGARLVNLMQVFRAAWDSSGDFGTLELRRGSVSSLTLSSIFSTVLPMLFVAAFLGYFSAVSRIITDEIRSPRRSYLVGCGLKLPVFWLANFIFDYSVWLIGSICIFFVFAFALDIAHYRSSAGLLFWGFIVDGISVVLFVYALSFVFSEPEISSIFVMVLQALSCFLNFAITALFHDDGSVKPWITSFVPLTNLFHTFLIAGQSPPAAFSDLWSAGATEPLLVCSCASVVVYPAVIATIELLRRIVEAARAASHFRRLPRAPRAAVCEEALSAAAAAQDAANEFAVRIRGASRVFADAKGRPVAAVRDVSLGVQRGALFGFLGANGAGKTTLMRMVTGEIPASRGSIDVDGAVSVCPQFNAHLTDAMTVAETFAFFADIYGRDDGPQMRDRFARELLLEDHMGKTIRNLSGGNARKLAIAVALLAPAHVVLLDEPTSSLDPLARHAAQRLIASFRGEKTVLLCTHSLDEAEQLCETLAVMLKGSVYIVGAPAYLSAKFGTEWRLDVLFGEQRDGKFAQFLRERVPSANLVIQRPTNEIYAIPTAEITIVELFALMDGAVGNAELGVRFFTASSTSLERVFMELVWRSEHQDDQ